MPREDISFQTSDKTTLRGWFYTPEASKCASSGKHPCVVLAHGFTALKEMDLDAFALHFTSTLPITALVYDNRNFGASDNSHNGHRHEIVPSEQISDYSDAITYAVSRSEVDPDKIAVWGSSYSGGHVLVVGAVDRRVKAVLCQAPMVDGWANFSRLVRPDFVGGMEGLFGQDRLTRAKGEEPARLPVVDADPTKPSALPTPDSYEFFHAWGGKSDWKNDVTVKSLELFRAYNPSSQIHRISPTPLLMSIAQNDVLTPTDLAIEAYTRAREPKKLNILPGGHFDAYTGKNFEGNAGVQTEFLRQWLL